MFIFCGGFDIIMMTIGSFYSKIHHIAFQFYNIDLWAGTPFVPLLMKAIIVAPHHIFAISISLLVSDYFNNDNLNFSKVLILSILLTFIIGTSVNIGIIFFIGVFLHYCSIFSKINNYKIFYIVITTLILTIPTLMTFANNSNVTSLFLSLRRVENTLGGAIFTHFFGNNLFFRIFDLVLNFILEYGILLFLAYKGFLLLKKKQQYISLNILFYCGIASLLFSLFVRVPYEGFAIMPMLFFSILLSIFSCHYFISIVNDINSFRFLKSLVIILSVQFFATCYSLIYDSFSRFLLPSRIEESTKNYIKKEVSHQIDSISNNNEYRIQIMSPWNNLDNKGIGTYMASIYTKSKPLYTADGAIGFGFNKIIMNEYFYDLLKIYNKDDSVLRAQLDNFTINKKNIDAPWYYYMENVRKAFENSDLISYEKLDVFYKKYNLNYFVFEPNSFNKIDYKLLDKLNFKHYKLKFDYLLIYK
jgi:hypothetical protein